MVSELLNNPSVTEIIFQGSDQIVAEKDGQLVSSTWNETEEKNTLLNEILQSLPKAPNYGHPIASGVWREFRVQVVCAPVYSGKSLIQLRRISKANEFKKLVPEDWRIDEKLVGYLEQKISNEKENFLVIGPTGCGKTTLLKAMLSNFCKEDRVVCIEDTPELPLVNDLSCNLTTYDSSSDEVADVSLNDLVKASLRLRPDRIIMGEMRGEEASSFLLMLSTGHKGSGATIHAHSAQDALYRLEMLIQMGSSWSLETVRRLIKTSLKCLIVLGRDEKTGKRYIKEVSEIAGLEEQGFLVHQVYSTNNSFF